MHPFDHTKFLGYVCEVTPQYVRVQVPTAKLLHTFYNNGQLYYGGTVGCFVVVEGVEYGFLGRLFELNLPQGEKTEITDQKIHMDDTDFHPIAKIELLALFSVYQPETIIKTISRYPAIGAKVYSCSDEQIGAYISNFGIKPTDTDVPFAPIGKLTSNNAICNISLNSLFGRHCAVLGTTGGGKSWTVAKLLELTSKFTNNKCILIDATGEYNSISDDMTSIELGTGEYIFDYQKLTIDELYYLLHPSSKTQVPKLMEAIRSLKMSKIDTDGALFEYYPKDSNGQVLSKNICKCQKPRRSFDVFRYRNTTRIETNTCDFDFELLAQQITYECVWDNPGVWGNRVENDVSNCVSLISRVNNIMSTSEYNQIFGFRKSTIPRCKDLSQEIINYIDNSDKNILRLDFSKVSFDYQVREILVNAIGKMLLTEAREGKYKEKAVIVFIDEAHQFLNKSIADEYFSAKPLDAFEQISKEARKYGLFLCIATQMPRDIPLGTLSQMGTFIVHRLINEQDKKAVESAASSANRSSLSFLPILGEGEALLVGVDFPMPLTIKIDAPDKKPDSNTPKLKKK
jgi:energy-coupling factor transporter ATP-binding protein EcfA2